MFIYFMGLLLTFFTLVGTLGFMYQSDPKAFYDKRGNLEYNLIFGLAIFLVMGSLLWPVIISLIILAIPAMIIFTIGKTIAKMVKGKNND